MAEHEQLDLDQWRRIRDSQKAQLQPYETLLEKLEEQKGDKLADYDYLSQLRPLNIVQSRGIRSLILRQIEKGKSVTAEFLIRTVAYVCNHLAPIPRTVPAQAGQQRTSTEFDMATVKQRANDFVALALDANGIRFKNLKPTGGKGNQEMYDTMWE